MTDNLPAVPTSREVARSDTDSWIDVVTDVAELANRISGTEFVPRNLRGNIAATAAAILYGREVGLPPMTTLTQTHVIEGKPAMSAEAMRAMVLAAGHSIHVVETTGARCVMRGRRANSEESTEIVWTIDMARAAGVANKQVWKQYPRQMLQARATTELVRLVFPDVIHGFRSVEEFNQLDGVAVVEDAEGNTAPAEGSKVTRRRAPAKKAAAPPAAVQGPVADAADMDGPPLPGADPSPEPVDQSVGGEAGGEAAEPPADNQDQQDVVDAELVDDGPPLEEPPAAEDREQVEQDPKPGPSTRAQHRLLFARFAAFDIEADGERLAYTSALVGREVESFNGLSKQEASTLVETLALIGSREDLDALVDAAEERRG